MSVPQVRIAVIGGSTILGSGFPGALDGVEVLEEAVVYDTPFGPTAPFTHASVGGNEFLFVPFHGITRDILNTEPDSAGERVFYVLLKAGVTKIIGTALCGSTNPLLDPADAVIPDAFVDYTTKRAQRLFRAIKAKGEDVEYFSYRLHQPFCPRLSGLLVAGSKKAGFPRVFPRGIVGVAEGPRLESPSEIRLRYTNQAGLDRVDRGRGFQGVPEPLARPLCRGPASRGQAHGNRGRELRLRLQPLALDAHLNFL